MFPRKTRPCPKGKNCNYLHVFPNPQNLFTGARHRKRRSRSRSRDRSESTRSLARSTLSRHHVTSSTRRERSRDRSRRGSRSRSRSPVTRHKSRRFLTGWKSRSRSRSRESTNRLSQLKSSRRSRTATLNRSRSRSRDRKRSRSKVCKEQNSDEDEERTAQKKKKKEKKSKKKKRKRTVSEANSCEDRSARIMDEVSLAVNTETQSQTTDETKHCDDSNDKDSSSKVKALHDYNDKLPSAEFDEKIRETSIGGESEASVRAALEAIDEYCDATVSSSQSSCGFELIP